MAGSESGTLQIQLLGPPAVLWGGNPLQITRRSLRALLFYVACEGQVSRSELIELFWPEDAIDRGRQNLRTALARLRSELPSPDLLDVTPDHVFLKPSQVVVDLSQFRDLAQPALRIASQIPSGTVLPERIVQQMRQAAQLWRSPRFLAGFSLSDDSLGLDLWLTNTSQQAEEMYFRILTRLADHAAAAGNLDGALEWAQVALEVDPWAGELHQRVIRWMVSLNRSSAAQGYADTLLKRYAVEDEPVPTELMEQINQLSQNGSTAALLLEEGWPASLQARVPMVGRGGELNALQAAFQRGGMAILWGEAGLGKTRLAYELHRAAEHRSRLLFLNAIQDENSLPFQPLIDALRRSIRQEEWNRMPASWLPPLAHLLPELAEPLPLASFPAPVPPELQRGYLYEALHKLLLEAAKGIRWLVVVDNAQWCDESTLAVLSYLVERRFFNDHGFLLMTARIEEPAQSLDSFVLRHRGKLACQVFNLQPLDASEVAELAQRVLDQPLSEPQALRLAEETGGNPLFLLETLYALLDHAPSTSLSLAFEKLPIGGSLHSLLSARLERLHPLTRQVAAAAAVLGEVFTPELLETVTGQPPEVVVNALEELDTAHMVEPLPGSPSPGYSFIHGQVREVIHWKQGPARHRLLHLNAARALEANSADPNRIAASLAQHYESAGELFIAFLYWLKAGEYALSRLSPEEAEKAYQAAERLAQRTASPIPDEQLFQLYTHWGEIALARRDTARVEQVFSRLQKAGEERQSSLLLGSALGGLAELSVLKGESVATLDLFHRAIYHLEQLSSPLGLIRVYDHLGWYLVGLTRYADAEGVFEKALKRAGALHDEVIDQQVSSIKFHLTMAHILTGRLSQASVIGSQLLGESQPVSTMYGHLVKGMTAFYGGDLRAALEHATLGGPLAQTLQNPVLAGYFALTRTEAELETGELDHAWQDLQLALAQAKNHQYRGIESYLLAVLGSLHYRIGDYSDAVSCFREGIRVGTGNWDSLTCQVRVGNTLVEMGNPEAGLREVEDALNRALKIDLATVIVPAMAARARLLILVGRTAEALDAVGELNRRYRDQGFSLVEKCEAWVFAQAAGARGDRVELLRQSERLINRSRKSGSVWWELEGFRLLRSLGPLDSAMAGRVEQLLDRLDQNTHLPELRHKVESYLRSTQDHLLSK